MAKSESLDFKGVVSLYKDGEHIWTLNNKITYSGRAYLLKIISKALHIGYDMSSIFHNLNGYLDNNAYLCCAAFGSGGNMSGSILPKPASYSDTMLYNALPIQKLNTGDSGADPEFVKKAYENYIMVDPAPEDMPSDQCYHISPGMTIYQTGDSIPLYFKRLKSTSDINYTSIHPSNQISNGVEMIDNLEFISSFVTFEINITKSDFVDIGSRNEGINELGLYLGSIARDRNYVIDNPTLDPLTHSQDLGIYAADLKDGEHINEYGCRHFVDNSYPIMFSHLTFPTESLQEGANLVFKYSIFV